ncbi:MAG: PD-(D/E)XK nuclease family protein [Proteocatella sp.]
MELILKADNLLKQMNLIIEQNNKLKKFNGGDFNIFSILNMERLEVRTHSALIYELLNPKGSHSQGYTYLKIFIDDILKIENFDFKNVKVDRERSIQSLGRIDLVIENEDTLIIIEMKIDAGDQENQLKRYNEYCIQCGKKYHIFYLTLYGYEASEYSTGNEAINYDCISFEVDIKNWINACICSKNTPTLPIIRETLVQYSKLIDKITNQLEGGLKMELNELLLKDNNLYIAEQIAKTIPYAKATLEYRFWKELIDRYNPKIEIFGVKHFKHDFFEDEKRAINIIADQRKSKKGEICFDYILGKYKNQNLCLSIGFFGKEEHIYASLTLKDENSYYIPFKDYDSKILKTIEELGFSHSPDSKYKYTYLEYDLNFNTDSILKLQNETAFNLAIDFVGNAILDIIKKIIDHPYIIEFQ